LRTLEQLLEAGEVLETLFERLGAVGGVGQGGFAVEPSALLLRAQKLAQAFHAHTGGREVFNYPIAQGAMHSI
jgi:hypothetical protein